MTMAGLLASVCQRHGLDSEDIKGPDRFKDVVVARKEFCRSAMELGIWTSGQIAIFLNRHKSSVLYLAGRLNGRGTK